MKLTYGFFKKFIPVRFKTLVVTKVTLIRQFGFFFKFKILLKLIKTHRAEDLQKWRIMTDEYGFLLRGVALSNQLPPFYRDDRFLKAYSQGVGNEIESVFQHPNDLIIWRAHLLTWFLSQNAPKDGDFVECGVWYGWLSKIIVNYLRFENEPRQFYLVDGFNSDHPVHTTYFDPLSGGDLFSYVKKKFNYPNVHLIKGWVPDVFTKPVFSNISKVAYLSIDMNSNLAEKSALEYFYPKLVTGGIVYLDDYGHNYAGLVDVVDDFLRDKPEKLLYLACGSAIFVKQ